MNAALDRFCFPVEEKFDSEELGRDVSGDSVKDKADNACHLTGVLF